MNAPIEFETQRLLLRQWRAADRDPFAALNADAVVMAHFPAPLTRAQSDSLADRCERLIEERRWGVAYQPVTKEFRCMTFCRPLVHGRYALAAAAIH